MAIDGLPKDQNKKHGFTSINDIILQVYCQTACLCKGTDLISTGGQIRLHGITNRASIAKTSTLKNDEQIHANMKAFFRCNMSVEIFGCKMRQKISFHKMIANFPGFLISSAALRP